ncbi:neuralized-like protein 4 [Saccoglossus kowalevskii]
MCYCKSCHKIRGDKAVYKRGDPAKDYVLPLGWARFPLNVSVVKSSYHVVFHGTETDCLEDILNDGLLLPGDKTRSGYIIKEKWGHFNDYHKPPGFNTKQIFLSPSINYSGNPIYSYIHKWYDYKYATWYDAQVALQVWLRPGSYSVNHHTISATHKIDEHISNSELEWSTTDRSAVVPYGLLIHLG